MRQFTLCTLGILLFSVLAPCTAVFAQVPGCKDPSATNYNSSATISDGSCLYNSATLTPQPKTNLDPVLLESSGLQLAGNWLWSFNDSGHDPVIYRVDSLTGSVLQTVTLGGASNVDWEDIAFDGTSLYIGDFGNNASGNRTDLKIYKFPLSAIPDYPGNTDVTIPAGQIEIIRFRYNDQSNPPASADPNTTEFDCEAMIVDNGKIHLFSKNWIKLNTTHYIIDDIAAGTYTAMPVETLATGYLVTAADKAPGTDLIVLLGYDAGIPFNHYLHLISGYHDGLYFNGNNRRLDLGNVLNMGQAEGITLRSSTYGYISNERVDRFPVSVAEQLQTFTTTGFVPAYVLPLDLKTFTVTPRSGEHQLAWQFAAAVQSLQVQYSSNGKDFITIHAIGNSTAGSFAYKPMAANNCYRLTWKSISGRERYSNVVCLSAENKTSFGSIVLRSSGELSFRFSGRANSEASFRLVSADGKLIAQTKPLMLSQGQNLVQLSQTLKRNALYFLQAFDKGIATVTQLQVQ